jgi:hypothetical protein
MFLDSFNLSLTFKKNVISDLEVQTINERFLKLENDIAIPSNFK